MEINQKEQLKVEYKGLEKSLIESRAVIKEFTYSLDEFSEKADHRNAREHRSYVYALCERVGDSLIPFYIGEGKGPRVWSHELAASEQIRLLEEELTAKGEIEELEIRKKDLKEKIKKIDDIKGRGGIIEKYIIKWGMTSKEAFMAESALINLLQISGLKFDASCEKKDKLTNIVKGHQSEGEKIVSETEARTVEDFCEMYAKEPLYFEDLQKNKVKALLININSGYSKCKEFKRKEDYEKAIRDTACGNWKMRSIKELDKLGIEYIFATVQARVVGIYKIKEVNGKKFHYSYESAKDNSEYPYGEDTVPYRNSDYEFAQTIMEVANRKGKKPENMVLNDMPENYKKVYTIKVKSENKELDPSKAFKNALERKYMILQNLSKDDPNYTEFIGYMYRRIIHTDEYVENTKNIKKMERAEAIKAGKTKDLPNPDKVTNNIYGSGNPLKYIEG